MDKFKSDQLKRWLDTDDEAQKTRAELFFVAPTLENIRDGKLPLDKIDPDVDEIITDLTNRQINGKLPIRQSILLDKLTGLE